MFDAMTLLAVNTPRVGRLAADMTNVEAFA
jgi:hypothetical protein